MLHTHCCRAALLVAFAGCAAWVCGELVPTSDEASQPCARALLLVAHPDDEALFAGEALLGRVATLPGGCRRAKWHVVSVTCADVRDRREDFRRSLQVARSYSLAAEITEEVWDFTDCNLAHCVHFRDRASGPSLADRLEVLLEPDRWDYVVTHNEQGEYHHIQHIGLHRAVSQTLRKSERQQTQMLVFDPIPEINASMSIGKRRMLQAYFMGTNVKPPRVLLIESLSQYSERLSEVSQFQRPRVLALSYFQGAIEHGALHFQYGWALARHIDWGDTGTFTAQSAAPIVADMLNNIRVVACQTKVGSAPYYPLICQSLRHHLSTGLADVREHLLHMEIAGLPETSSPEQAFSTAELSGSNFTCVQKTASMGRFGTVGIWTITGKPRAQPIWIELLIVRPILVGWRHGYKGRTYKVIGGAGMFQVDLSTGTARFSGTARPSEAREDGGMVRPVVAQPHDLVGWRIFGVEQQEAEGSKLIDRDDPQQGDVMCIGAKGCDEANLCVFDSTPPAISNDLRVSTEIYRGSRFMLREKSSASPFAVRPALDISEFLEAHTSYEELMTLRNRLDHPDLSLFEDKIRLRRELLPEVGAPSTPSIHLSNSDFEIKKHLDGKHAFVVKPSHMSESQNVFVVRDGINLLQAAWGNPEPQVTVDQIQAAVHSFTKSSALDWECRALVSARPGVVVEELVLAQDAQGRRSVDEYKFYIVWGEVVLGENVPFSSGAAMEISRDGRIFTSKVDCPPYCVASCYLDMVSLAEKVARNARADFLRVDLLVEGRCHAFYVSEVELFPASDFSQPIKTWIAERWRHGYGY